MKSNPKAFFKYLNSKRKIKQTVTVLKDSAGRLTDSPKDSANILAEFFSSTFIKEPPGPVPTLSSNSGEAPHYISDLIITGSSVRDALMSLNISKSFGPDNLHPKLLAYLGDNNNFVTAVTQLFNNCYNKGCIPEIWKEARITALHKKGPVTDAENYRPISLTSILCKIYERFIRSHMLDHVGASLTNQQHGFVSGRSCLSNLLECMDIVNKIIADGDFVDILYLDFQKAFDTVPHRRLLAKLESYGIKGKTLNVLTDFLSGRTFNVKVGDSLSDTHHVTSGIPQGTVLGPLLFILYINDLPEGISNYISLFADDVKIITKSSTAAINQEDLDKLCEWQNKWLLRFNTKDSKCKVLHIGKSNPHNLYNLEGEVLPEVTCEKDLGVYVDSNLTWHENITKSVNKAKSCIAWVTRNVISREPQVMINIYKTLVRPHLEYCVQLWSPSPRYGNWKVIDEIEKVQRMYTRLIDGVGLKPYQERLHDLGLTTLLERRARGDIIETFRIISGIANYGSNLFKISRSGYNIIDNTYHRTYSYGSDFFPRRVVSYWNKIPDHVKDATSVDSFKIKLDRYRTKNYDRKGNYWELSNIIYDRINDSGRGEYNEFLMDNPHIAKRRGINIT